MAGLTVPAMVFDILFGILSGLVYGFVWFARNKYRKDGFEESFNPMKLTATLIIAAFVGGVVASTGESVTFETLEQQFLLYVGAISLLEGVLKMLNDRYDLL